MISYISSLASCKSNYTLTIYHCPQLCRVESSDATVCDFAEGLAPVKLQPAPCKRVERMRDKILKYAADCPIAASEAGGWPTAARILDPVRASIVCEGASQMLQVVLSTQYLWVRGCCFNLTVPGPIVNRES